jgi:hypothetical protein
MSSCGPFLAHACLSLIFLVVSGVVSAGGSDAISSMFDPAAQRTSAMSMGSQGSNFSAGMGVNPQQQQNQFMNQGMGMQAGMSNMNPTMGGMMNPGMSMQAGINNMNQGMGACKVV